MNKWMTGRTSGACLCTVALAACVLTVKPAQAQVHEQDRIPISPQTLTAQDQAAQLARDAAVAVHAGRYAEAEVEARQAASFSPLAGVPEQIVAAALDAEGKDEEALQAYRVMVVDEKTSYPSVLLPYAQLLLKSGHWAQAVAVYDQVLPSLPDVGPPSETSIIHDGDLMRANSHFSPDVPDSVALGTALHIARGMIYNVSDAWAGESQKTEAMAEYGKALQLAPDNALANYFYGVGWQKLSPAEKAKFGTAQQARAALQKADRRGDRYVKGAAEESLQLDEGIRLWARQHPSWYRTVAGGTAAGR